METKTLTTTPLRKAAELKLIVLEEMQVVLMPLKICEGPSCRYTSRGCFM